MLSHAYTDKIRHPKIGITNFGGILPHSARVRKQKTLKVLCFVISVEDYHKLTQIQFLIQPPLGSQTFRVVKTVAGHRIICSMSVCKLFYPLTIATPPCNSTCTRKVVLLTLFLPHKGKLVSMAFIRRKTHISHRLNLFFGQFSEFKLDHAKSEQNCFVWLWHEERMLLHARIWEMPIFRLFFLMTQNVSLIISSSFLPAQKIT